MKEYLVVKQIGAFKPTVAETFTNEADATEYVNIMNRNDSDWNYRAYKLL